jgi:hypothetical protein
MHRQEPETCPTVPNGEGQFALGSFPFDTLVRQDTRAPLGSEP